MPAASRPSPASSWSASVAAAAVPAAVADPGTSRPEADKRLAQRGPQTSDGVRGRLAPYVPRALRTPPVITNDVTWAVRPASRSGSGTRSTRGGRTARTC